jgi:mannosyltransferase OCH1-like enzyme
MCSKYYKNWHGNIFELYNITIKNSNGFNKLRLQVFTNEYIPYIISYNSSQTLKFTHSIMISNVYASQN